MKYIFQGNEFTLQDESVDSPDFSDEVDKIRRNIVAKYLDANNLNFLVGTGASRYSGAEAINVDTEPRRYKETIDKFYATKTNKKIRETVRSYRDLRVEQILDRLFTLKAYIDEVEGRSITRKNLNKLIQDIQQAFIEECVLNIDYGRNEYHKVFVKKLLTRKNSLNKVNIFTLNYDMLFEFSAEEMNVLINNGFVGFQSRSFFPPSFKVDSYLKAKANEQRFNKTFNLFKLHGSLSWEFDQYAAPYGISEKQIRLTKSRKIDFGSLSNDLIIYPVQNKKKKSLDLPYSELFRQFAEALNQNQSVLVVIGYSFLDEHVNDLITNALSNPDFNIAIFTFEDIDCAPLGSYLSSISKRAVDDNRITIFSGTYFGDFKNIATILMPYVDEFDPVQESYQTFLRLKGDQN